ncbi:4-oxalocrotonate tautomerase [Aromatoleum toluvorans]|uniref:4-oxalocrotonate tautomerase n=1 Tax=Aromatoleum toluvorans TaxID=92002 RepID=A0ABX1Q000_9RHOO|nr:4-oxalocrotonate tautomerase [Aromatoleum toluvorans]NMG43839.1 4-oxalocrotonate tautomerase [Aromatoleum toluvorans]
MPILHFHLVEGQYGAEQHRRLLAESSRFFAEVLRCPLDRVRAFIHLYRPELVAVGGEIAGERRAPYFSFIVMEGRALDERQRLLAGFTDIVVAALGVDRAEVRGGIVPVLPENWSIGGVPGSVMRQSEIVARAAANAS